MTYHELLEQAHIDDFTTSTRDFLTCIAVDMAKYLSTWPKLDEELGSIANSLHYLGILLDYPIELEASPEQWFNLEGFGHFKECYTFSPSFVIKFCAERNPTTDEAKLLDDAWANDMDDVFLSTKYYDLPHPLYSENLEKDDEECEIWDESVGNWVENPDWHDDTILLSVCIQPRVLSAEKRYAEADIPDIFNKPVDAECGVSGSVWEETREFLGLPHDANRYDFQGLNGVCRLWARDFKNLYGVARLRQFAKFCEEFHVWDLHSENVGYTLPGADGIQYPIVLDWMSR